MIIDLNIINNRLLLDLSDFFTPLGDEKVQRPDKECKQIDISVKEDFSYKLAT